MISFNMNEREKIRLELHKKYHIWLTDSNMDNYIDFIILDRKRILKPLKVYYNLHSSFQTSLLEKAINQVFKKAGVKL